MSSGEDRQADSSLEPVPATAASSPVRASGMEVLRKKFLDFYDAEYHEVVRFVMRDGASLYDAQDAAHEAFFQAYRKVQAGQWQHLADPRAWTRKVALNHHRAQRRFVVPTDPVPEAPEQGLGHAELTGQALDLVAALRLLDADAREVLAFHLDDIPTSAIATELGITEQRVRDLLKKARRKLKKHLWVIGNPRREDTP
jgi:RNA polymerase sigma factor (sigma-70 family)